MKKRPLCLLAISVACVLLLLSWWCLWMANYITEASFKDMTPPMLSATMKHSNVRPNSVKPTHSVAAEQKKKGDCKLPNGDMHVCWIGEDMLSKEGKFYQTLKSKASKDGIIILASVDSSFIDMAINMYETSFKRFKISNYLFICSDSLAVELLALKHIDCFLYNQDTKNDVATEFGTKDFILKMRVKMKMMTAALMLGFTTVLSDVDIVFFRDPTPHLKIEEDISFMSDVVIDNCGFYVARPTSASISLHKQVLISVMTKLISDQEAMKPLIKSMIAKKSLRKTNLDKNQFACGLVYFENQKRMFRSDSPCLEKTCSTDVVHNNWIVSKAAKIYRFKEMGMWDYDFNTYYSNQSSKYLQYSNPLDFGNDNKEREKNALRTGLTIARILNRTLILPKFHCNGCGSPPCKIANDHCAFNAHYHVRTFDVVFENKYREHVFLEHALVPQNIKNSVSAEIFISSKKLLEKVKPSKDMKIYNASDFNEGKVSPTDIKKWLGEDASMKHFSVLRFHSLYFEITDSSKDWTDTLNKALRWSDYRQLKGR